MKNLTRYTILTILTLIVVFGVSAPTAHASLVTELLGALAGGILTIATGLLAIFAWAVLTVAGWLLGAAGTLLNVGMYLTTHLGVFIDQSPVIYTVWTIIRDISSTLLIFFILFAAIQKILGLESASYGELVKNIIIVGILINFSFFFSRVLIDLSNIVSLEFYNAIAPTNTAQDDATRKANITNISALISGGTNGKGGLLTSGGISDILMGALQVNSFWSGKGLKFTDLLGKNEVSANINILILQVAGIIVVSLTIINFLIIALVCVARIAILLFLLGFSPIWIAAKGMPKLNDLSKEWVDQFKIQLIFLPVYLAFLYVALRIVTASKLNTLITASANADNPWLNIINLTVGFGIIIVLLNVPMIAAAKVAGGSNGLIDKAYKGLRSKAVGLARGAVTNGTKGIWNNTGGRVASRVAQNASFQKFAGDYKVGELMLKGTRGVAGNYNKNLDAKIKSREDFAKTLDTKGAAAYADRLSGSIGSHAGTGLMHTIGRTDRVAAARILNTRLSEVRTDQDKLTSELRKHLAASRGGRALTTYEIDRLDRLQGTHVGHNNTTYALGTMRNGRNVADLDVNEIWDAQDDFDKINTQVNQFSTTLGASTKATAKRNY